MKYEIYIGIYLRNSYQHAKDYDGIVKFWYLTTRSVYIRKETLLFMSLNKLNDL